MAYKQPRVPPMKEDMQPAAYIRELILFLKDFSLETWMAVRTLQGRLNDAPQEEEEEPEEMLTAQEVRALLSEQAQALREEMEERAQSTRRDSIDSALPVGIVISLATADDPNALYPWQVWTQIMDGRVEIAANSDYPLGSTGGEETHTLTESEIPQHGHEGIYYAGNQGAVTLNSGTKGYKLTWTQGSGSGYDELDTGVTGGSQAHNNMQPYVARNVWQRTA